MVDTYVHVQPLFLHLSPYSDVKQPPPKYTGNWTHLAHVSTNQIVEGSRSTQAREATGLNDVSPDLERSGGMNHTTLWRLLESVSPRTVLKKQGCLFLAEPCRIRFRYRFFNRSQCFLEIVRYKAI